MGSIAGEVPGGLSLGSSDGKVVIAYLAVQVK